MNDKKREEHVEELLDKLLKEVRNDGENIQEIVKRIDKEMLEDFKSEVFNQFMAISNKKFSELELHDFFTEDVLQDIFNNSAFIAISLHDPDYLFEEEEFYWSQHIFKEIENSIDLDKLKRELDLEKERDKNGL